MPCCRASRRSASRDLAAAPHLSRLDRRT
jgi:hypothetical protein